MDEHASLPAIVPEVAAVARIKSEIDIADRSRILAVGDSLRTDIAGAAGAGIDSLLIAGGIHAEEFGTTGEQLPDLGRVEAALRESGYNPVGVAWRLCW